MSMLSRWNRDRKSGNGSRSSTPSRRDPDSDWETMARPFNALQEQVNRLFEDFFDDMPLGRSTSQWMNRSTEGYRPRLDVSETENDFTIAADIPGMNEDDIEVAVSDDALTIRGERREESEDRETDYVRRERAYGFFERRIPLPRGVETDDISARFKDGVLTVSLPKTDDAKHDWRTIEVKRD